MSNQSALSNHVKPYDKLKELIRSNEVQDRFTQVLGERAPAFLASILATVSLSDKLQTCEPNSVLISALKAAVLDLPIEPTLGFACIIPFYDHKKNATLAQFQVMKKGFIQLALRTNQYEALNAILIYEGEEVKVDRLSGRIILNGKRTGDGVQGYAAYFKLLGGFEKYLYMTVEEVEAHGKKYSKSYNDAGSLWQKNFDAMGLKTVIKQLLTHYGIMSIQMQKAIREDADDESLADRLAIADTEDMIEGTMTEITPEEPPVEPVAEGQQPLL